MANSRQGALIFAGISGYGQSFSGVALEHARNNLEELLQIVVDQTRPPLVISALDGAGVFSYAPAGSFKQGQTLVEMVENSSLAFRQARESVAQNSPCDCDVCRDISGMNLHFFIHYGSYSIQQVAGNKELVGSDVELLYRLSKNASAFMDGCHSFAVYTPMVIQALGLDIITEQLPLFQQADEQFGPLALRVQDLNDVWAREQRLQNVEVDPGQAMVNLDLEYPLPPEQMWDYLTTAEYRNIIEGSTRQTVIARPNGRTGPGTIYSCTHGRITSDQIVVDWRPFESYSWATHSSVTRTRLLHTIRLEPVPVGTRVTFLWGHAQGRIGLRRAGDLFVRYYSRGLRKRMVRLKQQIFRDVTDGRTPRPERTEISNQQLEIAVGDALHGPPAADR